MDPVWSENGLYHFVITNYFYDYNCDEWKCPAFLNLVYGPMILPPTPPHCCESTLIIAFICVSHVSLRFFLHSHLLDSVSQVAALKAFKHSDVPKAFFFVLV